MGAPVGYCDAIDSASDTGIGILPEEELPDGVAMFNTTRQVAASFGMAFVVAMVNMTDHHLHLGTSQQGIQAGFLTCFAILVLAFFFHTDRQEFLHHQKADN